MIEEKDKMLPDMPAEQREKVLLERIKKRVAVVKGNEGKEKLMSFYEDRAMFYGRLWKVLQTLDEKGKL